MAKKVITRLSPVSGMAYSVTRSSCKNKHRLYKVYAVENWTALIYEVRIRCKQSRINKVKTVFYKDSKNRTAVKIKALGLKIYIQKSY